MAVTFTTELPSASIGSLDNGIEDEVTVNIGNTTDHGEYEVDYKESSSSTWLNGTTVPSSRCRCTGSRRVPASRR